MFSFDCCLVVPEAALVLIHEDNIYRFFFFLTFFSLFFSRWVVIRLLLLS